jgi:hypothetical protein
VADKELMAIIITTPSLPFSTQNRRKRPRHGVGSLQVWIRRPGFMGLYESRVELSPVDFSHTGMAFRCKQLLKPGDTVVLDLKKDQHKLTDMVAIVRYATRMSNHTRVGVEFDFSANERMQLLETDDELKSIESLLKGVVIVAGI